MMKTMRIAGKTAAASLIVVFLLAGCNLPLSGFTTPTPLPTATLLVPLATPTLPPPTPTPEPSPTATPQPVNIVFAPGATAGVEEGTIQAGQVKSYTIGANAHQPMILLLGSTNGDVTLGVFRADGSVLLDPAKKWTDWQWLLPATETYTIQVIGGATTENYTLTAKVAARINIPSGANSTSVSGTTPNGYVISYAVSANANQTMTVELTAAGTSAKIDVFGLAYGQLLVPPTSNLKTWTGVLPSTQDYIIEVIPSAGQVVNYSLSVKVE